MRATVRLGRVGGVAVDASWSVLVIVGLLAWSLATVTLPRISPGAPAAAYAAAGLAGAVGLMASVLAHELSHAAVARRHGVPVEGITLWLLGGMAKLGGHASDPGVELRIALAGPAASVAVGLGALMAAALLGALGLPALAGVTLAWLGLLNLVLAGFNLLPGAPLDGGRVLAALLWRHSGDEHDARRRAARAGRLLGQGLIGLGLVALLLGGALSGLWLAFLGWFLTVAAGAEERQEDVDEALGGLRLRNVMSAPVHTAPAGQDVASFVAGEVAATRIRSFPVVAPDGGPVGVVTVRQLWEVPPAAWPSTTLGEVARRGGMVEAGPDELLTAVLRRADAGRPVVVVEQGRVVGIVTPTDVARVLERGLLAAHAARGAGSTRAR